MNIAELEAIAADIERGESIFLEMAARSEIETLTVKLDRWRRAVATTEAKNPNHKLLGSARKIIAGFETELSGQRRAFLAACCPDRAKPN